MSDNTRGNTFIITLVIPNVADPNRPKPLRSHHSTPSAVALGRELGPNGACLGQDLTYG